MKKATERVERYLQHKHSANTRRAYENSWRAFELWATRNQVGCLPASPETVADYLAFLADTGLALATIRMRRTAIGEKHRVTGQPDPTEDELIQETVGGISWTLGQAQDKKSPILLDDLRRMINASPDTLMGIRDRAIILVGFAGAFRRSELAGLNVSDLKFGKDLRITVPRSKTDQEGRGLVKVIPPLPIPKLNPTLALKTWLSCAGIRSGPIFRRIDRWDELRPEKLSAQAIAIVVKRYAVLVGLDPNLFAGHSLRSGFITATALAGVPEWAIMEQTGHKSKAVMQGYIRASGRGAGSAVLAVLGKTK